MSSIVEASIASDSSFKKISQCISFSMNISETRLISVVDTIKCMTSLLSLLLTILDKKLSRIYAYKNNEQVGLTRGIRHS